MSQKEDQIMKSGDSFSLKMHARLCQVHIFENNHFSVANPMFHFQIFNFQSLLLLSCIEDVLSLHFFLLTSPLHGHSSGSRTNSKQFISLFKLIVVIWIILLQCCSYRFEEFIFNQIIIMIHPRLIKFLNFL